MKMEMEMPVTFFVNDELWSTNFYQIPFFNLDIISLFFHWCVTDFYLCSGAEYNMKLVPSSAAILFSWGYT
jgi:hypothetical protein